MACDRIYPCLTHRSAWIDHDGDLPLIEGALIRPEVDHLPGGGEPLPVWLWASKTGTTSAEVDLRWQPYLGRFDLEHTFQSRVECSGMWKWGSGPQSSTFPPPTPSPWRDTAR
ncbi:hypothetical protein J7E99_31070 [Streptomyces sp. ISL-44]|uniref:hypothetical protein n=1 Tax=Streptomyces sp. ISL-44 TaxID=2819184 RepID=UPI001BEBEC09|nr:hypothetical protein [Streptomyces sp. ISL-44]